MRHLFAMCTILLSLASGAAAKPLQLGVICNSPEAAAVFTVLHIGSVTWHRGLEKIVEDASSPTDWCIIGHVNPRRPNRQVEGIEGAQALTIIAQVGFSYINLLMPGLAVLPLLRGPNATDFELREFVRENGHPGYYLVYTIDSTN